MEDAELGAPFASMTRFSFMLQAVCLCFLSDALSLNPIRRCHPAEQQLLFVQPRKELN